MIDKITGQTEPFARNALMGDVKRFLESLNTKPHAPPRLNETATQIFLSPSFDSLYAGYLEIIFENFFESGMALDEILVGCYKEDRESAQTAIKELKNLYPGLFSGRNAEAGTVVVADSQAEEGLFRFSYYDDALALLEVLDFMDKKTADPDPSEREIQARRFVTKCHQALKEYLQVRQKDNAAQAGISFSPRPV